MRDIATTQLSGNLTRDVDLRALPSGVDVARLRVASGARRRQGEEWVEKTNYFTVDVYGAQARACAEHLTKGSRVLVDGELDWREWDDQQGQHRETVTVKARHVLFEGGRPNNVTPGSGRASAAPASTLPATATAPLAAAATQTVAADNGTADPDDLPF